MPPRVGTLVVGAGVSGLAYAHRRGPEADLLVLEADERAGGLLRTARGGRVGELRFECGPEAITAGNSAVRELFGELELPYQLPPPTVAQRWIARDGALMPVPTSLPALLKSPLLSAAGKLRALCEPLRPRERALDGSLADFLRHRFGAEVLERLAAPIVGGIFGGDPEQLGARAAFPRLVELVERHGSLVAGLWARRGEARPVLVRPTGGVEELARALSRPLGERLVTGRAARALERRGDLWRVETDAGTYEAERVVLALPVRTAARLLATAAPECAAELGRVETESLASVIHVWRWGRVRHELNGFGYLVAATDGEPVLGTLFSSSIDQQAAPIDRVVLRTLLGGSRARDVCRRSDAELLERSVASARPLLGLEGDPEWSDVRRWPDVLPRYGRDHLERLARVQRLAPPGLSLLGNYAGGIGVSSLIERSRALAAEHASERRLAAL
jgi:oxygen-dependent protoporphyrinogen oxidase